MRHGRPARSPFKAALSALKADVVGWQRRIAETQVLIEQLSTRAGIERDASGGAGAGPVVPQRKRRRRRHKPRPIIARKAKRRAAAKRVPGGLVAIPVAVPEPIAAKVEPAKAKVRGAEQFAAQLEELERIRIGIEAGGDGAKSTHKLQVRGHAVLKELNGRAKLPAWLDKAERMRWRRCAAHPEKAPKIRKPRKPTPPLAPPVVKRTDWHPDENGNLVREIITS